MKRIWISLSLVLSMILGLTACRQPAAVPILTSTSTEKASWTELASPTPAITFTSEPIDTPGPNSTTKPLPTVTRAATPNGSVLEMPEWVTNRNSNLILLTYRGEGGERPNKARLINPTTGEQLQVLLPEKFFHSYWKDGEQIVFVHGTYCDEPPTSITELNISRGTLKSYAVQDYPESIGGCYPQVEEPVAQFSSDLPERSVVVVNTMNDQKSPLTDPNDGIIDVAFQLSPNNEYIVIAQASATFEIPEIWSPAIGNQISVYRLFDRTLVMTVREESDLASLEFFPDSNQVIYMRDRENTPCLIVISSQSKKCIHNIPQQFPEAKIFLGKPTSDSKRIGFLYLKSDPRRGGLCFYDLFSGTSECPTDKFASFDGYGPVDYSLSSDEKYALFVYDEEGCPLPWCDAFQNPHIAVIDTTGNSMYELGNSTEIWEIWLQSDLSQTWRPLEETGQKH